MELARLTAKLRTLEDKERATAGVAGFREYIHIYLYTMRGNPRGKDLKDSEAPVEISEILL